MQQACESRQLCVKVKEQMTEHGKELRRRSRMELKKERTECQLKEGTARKSWQREAGV